MAAGRSAFGGRTQTALKGSRGYERRFVPLCLVFLEDFPTCMSVSSALRWST